MTDALDQIAEAAEQEPVDLRELVALAERQLSLQADVDKIKAELKTAEDDLKRVQLDQLPAAMKNARMPTFQLDNGMTVSSAEDMKVSVPAKRKEAIIAKMCEWGHGGKVNKHVIVDLGKGNDNAAKSLMAHAQEIGVEAVLVEDIPTGSVKAELNKRRKLGENDDLAFFGAFVVTKSTVK